MSRAAQPTPSNVELPSIPALFVKAALRRPQRGVLSLPDAVAKVNGYRPDRERLIAYDRLCGFAVRDAVPATWLHVLTFPLQLQLMAADTFPFAAAGTIHLSNTMTQMRPVRADEVLDLRVTQGNLRSHPKGAAFDLRCLVSVDGEPVWRGTSTYLATSARVDAEPMSPIQPVLPDGSVSQIWRLPENLGRRYAKVSGDVNPIHLHPLTARIFGMKRHLIHGMWTHARALAALGPNLPDAFDVTVYFTRPLTLPRTVGFVVERDEERVRFAVTKPDGSAAAMVGVLR